MKLLLFPIFFIISIYAFAFDELIDAKYNSISASWYTTTGDALEERAYEIDGFISPAHNFLLGYSYGNLETREIKESLEFLAGVDTSLDGLSNVVIEAFDLDNVVLTQAGEDILAQALIDEMVAVVPTTEVREDLSFGYIFKKENFHFIPYFSTGDLELKTINNLLIADIERNRVGAMIRYPFSENSILTIKAENISYGDYSYEEGYKESIEGIYNQMVVDLNEDDSTLNLEPLTEEQYSEIYSDAEAEINEIFDDTTTIVSLGLEYYNDTENISVSYEISTIDFDAFGFRVGTSYNF